MGGNYPRVKIANENFDDDNNNNNKNGETWSAGEDRTGGLEKGQTGGALYAYKLPDIIRRKQRIKSSKLLERKSLIAGGNNNQLPEEESSSLADMNEPIFLMSNQETCREGKHARKMRKMDISQWQRTTLHKGFKVRGWGGIFSPGAPGFPYVFRIPGMPTTVTSICH